MTRVKLFISSLICALALIELSGCATFDTALFLQRMPKATAADPVVQILCMWQQAEGHDPDGRPCKGFNGQILFLSRRKGTPVEVEGDVRIYLFDDQGSPDEQSKPLHQFNFDHGSWKIHLSRSSLGATYNVFVPYTRRETTEADCSLRIRLKPKAGPIVLSDFSNMPLSGHKKPLRGDAAQPVTKEEVERITAEAMAKGLQQSTTTTIPTTPTPKMRVAEFGNTESSKTNSIQLASHEVVEDAPKSSLETARIRQLETMMQKLLEEKANRDNAAEAVDFPSANQEPARLRDSAETDSRSERFKLKSPEERSAEVRERSHNAPLVRKAHPLDEEFKSPPVKATSEKAVKSNTETEADQPFETASSEPALSDSSETEFRRYRRKYR